MNNTRWSSSAIALVGIAAFGIGLAASLGRFSAPVASAQNGCTQPSESGCTMEMDTSVQAALNDSSTLHNWLLNVPGSNNFTLSLTNLAGDYQLWVYGPDESLLAQVNNPGTQDEVAEVTNIGSGVYWVVIDSPSGEASDAPYTLTATMITPPAPAGTLFDAYGNPIQPRPFTPY